MFGIGKIFNVIRAIAPFLQFIPALAPFAALFNIADQVANLVSNFKNGFSFLDLVSKFAPMPKVFGQNLFGSGFGLNSSAVNIWKNSSSFSSNLSKTFDLVGDTLNNLNQVNTARTNNYYSGAIRG